MEILENILLILCGVFCSEGVYNACINFSWRYSTEPEQVPQLLLYAVFLSPQNKH